jgi:pimeloyl-ACP methyl ester carboxylesterase
MKRLQVFLAASFFCLAILAAIGFTLFHFRWSIFPYAIGNRIDMLLQGSFLNKRAAHVIPAETVFLETDDGLRLAADLYLPAGQEPAPAIAMLHGCSRWGRKIGITRLLSSRLADQGYVVLALDFRAYGESEAPDQINDPSSWKMEEDIQAGVDYLAAHARVNAGRIYLVGHSMGAAFGLYSGIHDERIRKIVAIGPPRRAQERFQEEKRAFRERFLRNRQLEESISIAVLRRIGEPFAVENTFRYFQQEVHKPLLLVDGMLESAEDRDYLRHEYEKMRAPKQYVTVEGTCHYLGIVGLEWFKTLPGLRDVLIFDRKIVGEAVTLIAGFLRDGPG